MRDQTQEVTSENVASSWRKLIKACKFQVLDIPLAKHVETL